MCPSIAVLAGGADGGDGSGAGAGSGSSGASAGTGSGGDGAAADARGAPDYQRYPDCGYASHPVDVVTGRAFTHPIADLALPGPLPLEWRRMYSAKMADRDAGLGFGWGHTFGWEVDVGRQRITVWNEQGIAVDFPAIAEGAEVIGPWGWVLRREAWGYGVDADDGVWRLFSAPDRGEQRYRLTAVEDRNRNSIALAYDDGRLVEIADSAGRIVRVRSTPDGRIEAIEVKNAVAQGRWVVMASYAYSDAGDLIAATDADGHTSRYAYERHLLTEDTDRTGLTFHFRYDTKRRCVASWGDYAGRGDPSLVAGGPRTLNDGVTRVLGIHHCVFDYHDDGYSEVSDSTQTRRFFGTKHGTLAKRVEGGGVTTAVYGDDGHLLSRTDPLGATTCFDRGARGRIVRITDPLGRVTLIQRDATGLPVEVIDPAGGVTTATRDSRGNLELLRDASGAVTSFRRDARGLVVEEVSPNGGTTRVERDVQGNAIAVTLPNGAVWRYVYDAFGRRTAEVDPLGAVTRYDTSARGDLVAVHDAAGGVTRYAYDGEHHLTEIVSPGGHRTRLTWGGYHKLCRRVDANGNEVRLGYNVEGELVEVHNERGEVHRLAYGASGELIGETTFDGRQIRVAHDLCGRVTRVDQGWRSTTRLEWDAAGQLVRRELPDGSVEAFEHDALGDIVTATWPGGEVQFERDLLGRIVREVQVVGGEAQWVESAHDAEGNRVRRATSLGHRELIERDVLGARRRTVLDEAHAIDHERDVLGREIARRLPGGGRIESAYDPLGRLSGRRAVGPAVRRPVGVGEPAWVGELGGELTAEATYRYDLDGELVDAWDRERGRTAYRYDPIGQLLAAVPEKARAELFRYDPAGNVHEDGAGAPPRAYGEGNRLLRKGDTTYFWDEQGRLIEKRAPEGSWRYAWNGAGLLASVTRPDGAFVVFEYDPFARRVLKRVSRPEGPYGAMTLAEETRFVWDGDVLVHERTTAGGEAGGVRERTYCFEDESFAPVAHRESGVEAERWLHYVNDTIGTPERLIAADGRVEAQRTREVWGRNLNEAGARATTHIRFQGQQEDEETGLCYNRSRYYDPDVGRFISADPLGLRTGSNYYKYTSNPLRWVDPLGLVDVDPKTINFSQRTVGQETLQYQRDMDAGKWNWIKSGPLRAMDVNGQLVSYDNRRLLAAQNAGMKTVPVEIVDPDSVMPGSKKTWLQAFRKRRCDSRNLVAGGAVPPEGIALQPAVVE